MKTVNFRLSNFLYGLGGGGLISADQSIVDATNYCYYIFLLKSTIG